MFTVLYTAAAVAWYYGVCRSSLPPRSAAVFSVFWPVTMAAVAIHQLNRWTEAAFEWAVNRLN